VIGKFRKWVDNEHVDVELIRERPLDQIITQQEFIITFSGAVIRNISLQKV